MLSETPHAAHPTNFPHFPLSITIVFNARMNSERIGILVGVKFTIQINVEESNACKVKAIEQPIVACNQFS